MDIIHGHIWVIALRDIKKGEELFYNYGYDLDTRYETHPLFVQELLLSWFYHSKRALVKIKKRS